MAEPNCQSAGDDSWIYVAAAEFDYSYASWAIRCNGKVLIVDVTTDDLSGWSKIADFVQLLEDTFEGDVGAEDSLFDLIREPCMAPFRTHAPKLQDIESFTLQSYYVPEIFIYKLVSDGKDIKALRCRDVQHPMIARMSPQVALSDISDTSELLHLDASAIKLFPRLELEDVTSDGPAIVSVDNNAARYYFKPAEHRTSFLREVSILLQLKTKGLNKKFRLPVIHSIIYYSNEPDCILGMLLERIGDGETLADWLNGSRSPTSSLKKKWDDQLKEIVHVLHQHGLVWGDVKPDNVVIDREQNLWVIDFGGGYNPGYIDRDLMETVEGDLQGLSRISAELLEGEADPSSTFRASLDPDSIFEPDGLRDG